MLTPDAARSVTTLPSWLPMLVGIAVTALTAGLLTLIMPRGPVTATQVGIVLGTSLVLGLVLGRAIPGRWSLVLLPLSYMVAVEVIRRDAVGPTVDALRLDNPYGIVALIVGRGFHGLVALLPLMLGIGLSQSWHHALLHGHQPWRTVLSHPLLVIGCLLVLGLAILNAIPASTPPMLDADGRPLAGSLAELTTIEIGGREQHLLIRGQRTDLPVLLYLSGGPGQSDLPYSRVLFADLTAHFIVVGWDQRGTGKSYPALEPSEAVTLEQAIADTLAVSTYLRERFGVAKIYLMGESWGSTLGVLAVQRRPDLYYAWIGSGQMVSQRVTDQQLYHEVLALAERTGNSTLHAQMLAFGEPPYADIPYPNAIVMGQYPQLEPPYTPPRAYIERGTAAGLGPYGIFASEYNLVEKINVLRGLIDMFSLMYPQLQAIDFRHDVPKLDVPVYLLDGVAELPARRDLALEWYATLDAPLKRLYSFPDAGHSVAFEQFEALDQVIGPTILAETQP